MVKDERFPGDDAPYPYLWAPYGYGEVVQRRGPVGLGLQDGDELIYEGNDDNGSRGHRVGSRHAEGCDHA